MSTDQVLAAIDQALDDYTVSNDAMRWTPEAPAQPSPTSPWVQIGHLRGEHAVSFDGVEDDTRLWSFTHTPTTFTMELTIDTTALAVFARAFGVPLHIVTGDPHRRRRRHAVRVAYRRRQLARRRR